MELRDIEYFAVVAEHGNVRRAAEALALSPPALSKSLRRLEASMEAKLVERTPRGVSLTAVGAALLARISQLRLALKDVSREAIDLTAGRCGRIHVGANPVDCEHLAPACAKLLGDSPGLSIEIVVNDIDVMLPMLRAGELDVAIVVAPERTPEGFATEPLWTDEYAVVASARHPLAGRRRVTLEDVARERWALSESSVRPNQLLHRAFAAHGLPPPHVALQTRSQRLKLLLHSSSRLLGFASAAVVRSAGVALGLVELRVRELRFARPVCALYRTNGYLPPSARRLVEALVASRRNPRSS